MTTSFDPCHKDLRAKNVQRQISKVNYNMHLNFNYVEDYDTSIMHVCIHRSVSNILAIFYCMLLLLDPYFLHSVDISVWDAQVKSQPWKWYLF